MKRQLEPGVLIDQGGGSPPTVEPMVRESIGEVTEVHLEAFSGYMNAALGRGYVRAFLLWFCEAPDGVALTANLDGRIVGYVVGAPIGYNVRMTRDLAGVVAGAIIRRPWLVLRRDIRGVLSARLRLLSGEGEGGKTAPVEDGVPGATMSLVGIGVAGAARGRGVGGVLMKAFESTAMDRGMQVMQLTVYRDNVAACRVYECAGWKPTDLGGGASVCYEKRIGA